MKKVIRKIIGNPFVRGFVKTIPIIGTPVAEGLTNLATESGEKKKHSRASQVVQWCMVGLVVIDIIANKGENLKLLLDFLLSVLPTENPEV